MEWVKEGRYLIISAMVLTVLVGSMVVYLILNEYEGDQSIAPTTFEFGASIDSRNKTVTLIEHEKVVEWGNYLVVINDTFIMKKERYTVPGVSTTFYNFEWNPEKGCFYCVEVVFRKDRTPVWNGTVVASR